MRANDTTSEKAVRALRKKPARAIPLLQLLAYYALLVAAGVVLIWLVPGAREAIHAPTPGGTGQLDALVTGRNSAAGSGAVRSGPWEGPFGRLGLTAFAAIGALLLALPVAWVHMFTRRLRYDPSLVQSVIILPIVVAGVVLVVGNSLALAFALAGIVAGVRFRQKLNEPQEAVVVLLALGIGLAAGVQALDVALAVSLIFNVVVLELWRHDLGATFAGAAPLLASGDTSLIVARRAADREQIRREHEEDAAEMDMDGILVVHASDVNGARQGLDVSLSGVAKEWKVVGPLPSRKNGVSRLDVLLLFKKKGDPIELLGEIEERWSKHIAAAEYIPHRVRREEEDEDDDD